MSEYNINRTTFVQKKRNEQMRSWMYALVGLMCMLWALNSYQEMVPFFAILGIISSVGSIQASHLTNKFNAKYFAVAIICGCVMEMISCFMF